VIAFANHSRDEDVGFPFLGINKVIAFANHSRDEDVGFPFLGIEELIDGTAG
jgi:hypothetical protein